MNLITPDFGIIFWQTVTFVTVLWVLSRFAWKPILGVLQVREEAVAKAITQISEAKTCLQQVALERERLVEEITLERERIIAEALETKQKIIEQARHEALTIKEHLLEAAKIALNREEKRALEKVKDHLALLSIQLAEKLLHKELSHDQAQLELIERFIEDQRQLA